MLSQYGGVNFQYDGEGFRRKKAYGTDTVTYYYQDGSLLSEKHTDATKNLYFLHNGNEIVGFVDYHSTIFYYRKDVLGNVVAVYDLYGEEVASYTYDAWGNCTIGTNVDGLADLNPIRYRGYYYDKETQLYYLQTRYYDPATGRFISPDTVNYLDPETIHGLNLYAYCNNNPIMYVDPTGHFLKAIWDWFVNTFGAGITESETYEPIEIKTLFWGAEAGDSTTKVIAGDISKPISVYAEKPSEANWWQFWEYKVGLQANINEGGFYLSIGISELDLGFSNGDSSWEIMVGLDKIGVTKKQSVNFANRTAEKYVHSYIRTIPTLLAVIGLCYIFSKAPVLAPAILIPVFI